MNIPFVRTQGIWLGAAASICLTVSTPVAAQRVIGEVRLGTTVGSHTATSAGLELLPGPSIGVLVELSAMGPLGVYVGLVQTTFGCDSGFCTDRDVVITGRSASGGIALRRGSGWTRLGLLYGVVQPDTQSSSSAGLGLDGSVGFEFRVGRVNLSPGIVLRRHNGGGAPDSERAVSLGIELGLALLLSSPS